MQIFHRYAEDFDKSTKRKLAEFGFEIANDGVLNVSHDHPSFPEIKNLMDEIGGMALVTTKFTDKELRLSEQIIMKSNKISGYPQPEDDYREITFQESCNNCHRKKQIAPFRLKGEPKFGKSSVFQLNWVFDEFFVTPEAWETVFEPFGIKKREVLHYKTLEPLKTVVQLVIDQEIEIGIEGVSPCSCSLKTFPLTSAGPFAPLPNNIVAARSLERFSGGGWDSRSRVYISNELFSEIKKHKLRGFLFQATEPGFKEVR